MKKLVVLPVELETSSNNTFTFNGSICHLYMVDTELNLVEENWFINGYGHVNCLGYCEPDQIHTGSPNEVIIASTDNSLGLESISQGMVDSFIRNDGMFNVVSYHNKIDGVFNLQAKFKIN